MTPGALSSVAISDTFIYNGQSTEYKPIVSTVFSHFLNRVHALRYVKTEESPIQKNEELDFLKENMSNINLSATRLYSIMGNGDAFDKGLEGDLRLNLKNLHDSFQSIIDFPVTDPENTNFYKICLQKSYEIANSVLHPLLIIISNNGLTDKAILRDYYDSFNELFNIRETKIMQCLLTSMEEQNYVSVIMFLKMHQNNITEDKKIISLLTFLFSKTTDDTSKYNLVLCIFEAFPSKRLPGIIKFLQEKIGIKTSDKNIIPYNIQEYQLMEEESEPTPISSLACDAHLPEHTKKAQEEAKRLRLELISMKEKEKTEEMLLLAQLTIYLQMDSVLKSAA